MFEIIGEIVIFLVFATSIVCAIVEFSAVRFKKRHVRFGVQYIGLAVLSGRLVLGRFGTNGGSVAARDPQNSWVVQWIGSDIGFFLAMIVAGGCILYFSLAIPIQRWWENSVNEARKVEVKRLARKGKLDPVIAKDALHQWEQASRTQKVLAAQGEERDPTRNYQSQK